MLKNRLSDFQTPIFGVRNGCCPLPTIAERDKSPLQNLTFVTSVIDVFREMFERKKCVGYAGEVVTRTNYTTLSKK